MDKRLVIDTNILIGIWQNNLETLTTFSYLKTYTLSITIFTYVEFLAASPETHKIRCRKFLHRFSVIPFTSSCVQVAKNFAYKHVTPKEQFLDLFIAANVKANKVRFETSNKRHFKKYDL